MKYFIYLARCNDNSLYIGYSKNLKTREKRHNEGTGALYTKIRRPIKIIYSETFTSQIEAIQREQQIKKWTRIKKENLIKYGHPTKF